MVRLSNNDVQLLAYRVADSIHSSIPGTRTAFPIPRGGVPAAYAIAAAMHEKYSTPLRIVDDPKKADIFLDDIIDSGCTLQHWCDEHPGKPFFALVDKTNGEFQDQWVVFPWEDTPEKSIEDNVRRLLQFCGEDTRREGLLETPKRVAKAWSFWCSGYAQDPMSVMKAFEDGAESCDEMVIVRDIPIYSHCEHHMAAIIGEATIAYIPNGKILGLSKLARVADIFARRLQVQERLTNQIADALTAGLNPKGVGVVIKARHLCMESRGVCKQGHTTVTSALRGVFRDEPSTRSEFMSLVK